MSLLQSEFIIILYIYFILIEIFKKASLALQEQYVSNGSICNNVHCTELYVKTEVVHEVLVTCENVRVL